MGKYLDLVGLEHVMQSIQQKLRRKQDALSPDASITLKDNTIGVTTPVRGVTQKEYDALPEEEKARGMYVITDAAPTIGGGTGGGSVEEVYSTEEVRIGTWIDGKPLYRKCFSLKTPSSYGAFVRISNSLVDLGIGTVADIRGIIHKISPGENPTYRHIPDNGSGIGLSLDNCIMFYSNAPWYTLNDIAVVLEYTKTTDTAPTGTKEG